MSYDNERSVALKAEFAYDAGLAGVSIFIIMSSHFSVIIPSFSWSLISNLQVMTWSIDTDDFEGICNGPKFPLLRTLNHALHNRYVEQSNMESPSFQSLTHALCDQAPHMKPCTKSYLDMPRDGTSGKYEMASQQIKEMVAAPKRRRPHEVFCGVAFVKSGNSTQAGLPQ